MAPTTAEAQAQAQALMQDAMKDFDIQQGPAFLRLLAFAGGAASLGCAIFKIAHLTKAVSHPVMYILYGYIAIFAATTMLFEAKHEWIAKVSALSKYQDMLIKHCHFMTLMGGRGVFYLFQATLWLSFSDSLGELLYIACAGGLAFIGVLHVAAHSGIMPHQIATKAVHVAEKVTGRDLDKDGTVGAPAP